ncbi:glutamate--cysteine ligase [Advenella alkanexedens]|uniref:glutamate--cysteine ligase n=1 Tax=Advenella alkanexedens TaxID=1481665 RepID=UPI002674D5FF|nr:glutamate--cysteine ligase [Advenella alkanexedens]WKU20060.1 glutamate--cysteine ligase [Advenella alkanexedens]
MQRFTQLQQHRDILTRTMRGIEREGLRIDRNGHLSSKPHPLALGSALTHPHITTDYSEALLELITGTHTTVESLLQELTEIHQFVMQQNRNESLWMQSMPAILPPEKDIPIATYGSSNTGMLKHVYRRGLAERYGKKMQCIAGLHYNFSMPPELWPLLDFKGNTHQEQQSNGYLALIRNFTRYSWLLMYLFGASPTVSKSFLSDMPHGLQTFGHDTFYLPYATSLRMSDLGYQNDAQAALTLCYNDLDSFIQKMYNAVTQPWPEYAAIGTHRDGQWIQLNTNVLQIENEFYSSIRPKRTTSRGERPVMALKNHGVQYVEIRCLDVDPFEPIGISASTSHFMDAFLLFCAVSDSPLFPNDGHCARSQKNFAQVVRQGRDPGLTLNKEGISISVPDWGHEILNQVHAYAKELDIAYGTTQYSAAVELQQQKLENPDLTPSARLLQELRNSGLSLQDYTLQKSQEYADTLRFGELSVEADQKLKRMVQESILEQKEIEASDTESFEEYVAHYNDSLRRPD